MGRSKQSGMSRQLDYRRMAQSEKQRQAAINTPTWLKVVAHCVRRRVGANATRLHNNVAVAPHAVEAPGRRSQQRRPASPSSS